MVWKGSFQIWLHSGRLSLWTTILRTCLFIWQWIIHPTIIKQRHCGNWRTVRNNVVKGQQQWGPKTKPWGAPDFYLKGRGKGSTMDNRKLTVKLLIWKTHSRSCGGYVGWNKDRRASNGPLTNQLYEIQPKIVMAFGCSIVFLHEVFEV